MTKERDYQELYDRLLEEVSTLHRNNRRRIRVGMRMLLAVTLGLMLLMFLAEGNKVFTLMLWILSMLPSIPLSFILANVLPRWNTYCVCCGTEEQCSPTPSIHRLRRGLPGYLILFAPHAFEPQRQLSSSKPPSPLVFLLISTHFTATLGIPLTPPTL